MTMRRVVCTLPLLCAATAASAGAPPLVVALDADARAGLSPTHVEAKAHGQTLSCDGVLLADLLRKAGVLPEGKLPSAQLDHYVVVAARDGYRVVYSLAELDPGTGNRPVHLVDRCDAAPLDAQDGPLRLIAPQDARPARWVRQVESITVFDPD